MPAPVGGSNRTNAMYDPIIGLAIALLLGAYLVYSLLHPEKF
jgi:K+-transporting ATPase KdpF subunit